MFVVRDAHRHPWMQSAADVPGAIVVETGLPVWRPSVARGHITTYKRQPRVSYDAVAELLAWSSRLEIELAEQPDALARLLDRQFEAASEIAKLFARPDVGYVFGSPRGKLRLNGCALRAEYLLGRAYQDPRGVRDAVAVHPVRTAPAPGRRDRRRHLAERGVAGCETWSSTSARQTGTADDLRSPTRSASPLATRSDAVLSEGRARAVGGCDEDVTSNSLGAVAPALRRDDRRGAVDLARASPPPSWAGRSWEPLARSRPARSNRLQRRHGGSRVASTVRDVVRDRAQERERPGHAVRGVFGSAATDARARRRGDTGVGPVIAVALDRPGVPCDDGSDRRDRPPRSSADDHLRRRGICCSVPTFACRSLPGRAGGLKPARGRRPRTVSSRCGSRSFRASTSITRARVSPR